MPKTCVVPGCETGKRRCKIKYSVFKVTADQVLRRKWEAAIPGIRHLKSEHHICERHFEDEFISRKRVKHDLAGTIIAEVPYKRVRLKECAIPSKFDDQTLMGSIFAEKIAVSNGPDEKDPLEIMNVDEVPNWLKVERIDHQDQRIGVPAGNECIFSAEYKTESLDEQQLDKATPSTTALPISTDAVNNNRFQMEFAVMESDVTRDHSSIISNIHTEIHIADVRTMSRYKINSDGPTESLMTVKSEDPRTSSVMDETMKIGPERNQLSPVYFTVTQQVEIHFRTDLTLCNEDSVTTLPNSWSATISPSDKAQRLIISRASTDPVSGTPVLKKSLTIDSGKLITYYVHGKVVQEKSYQELPRILSKPEILPSVVMQFASLRVCDGLGDVNICLLDEDVATKDNMNMLRASECTLIGRNKRCTFCAKLRKGLMEKNARYAQYETWKRISVLSNPVDRHKLNVMRKKLNLERHKNNRKPSRLMTLMDSLREQRIKLPAKREKYC